MINVKHFIVAIIIAVTPVLCSADYSNDLHAVARIMSTTRDVLPSIPYEGKIKRYAEEHNISDKQMYEMLLYVARPDNEYNKSLQYGPWLRTLGVLASFHVEEAIPLFDYYMSLGDAPGILINHYGRLVKYDERLYEYISKSFNHGHIGVSSVRYTTLTILGSVPSIAPVAKFKMTRFLCDVHDDDLINAFARDHGLCVIIPDYSNSVERARDIEHMFDTLDMTQHAEHYSRDFKDYTKDEALAMMSNELARLKALPPGELIDLSARLDAELAALTNSAQTVGTATERAPIAGKDDEPAADDPERGSGYGWIAVGAGVFVAAIIGWVALRRRG